MPGVKAVVTGADFPDAERQPTADQDSQRNVIARDKVLYHGHAVAAVAATTGAQRQAALRAIEVDYEVLPPGAHRRRGDGRRTRRCCTTTLITKGVDPAPTEPSNVASRIAYRAAATSTRLRRGRRRRRARVHHQDGAPGLHRAARRRRRHHAERPLDRLVLDAGPLHHAHHARPRCWAGRRRS